MKLIEVLDVLEVDVTLVDTILDVRHRPDVQRRVGQSAVQQW